jgi:hypothetical protein
VNELIARVRDFYLASEADGGAPPRSRARSARLPVAAAVIGAPRDVGAMAHGLALALARDGGLPCAVVCRWRLRRDLGLTAPPRTAARRLARRLEGRGLACGGAGALVRVDLPDPPAEAALAAERAAGACAVPIVLGLAGPRDADVERLLMVQDLVVLAQGADDDPALGRLALESLSALPAPVVACRPPGGAAASLATAGIAVPGGVRRALRPALEAAR